MADNEGHKVRSFVLERPIRAAIIVFVVASVFLTIAAIATGSTAGRYIDVGIASAFLAFVIIGNALAASRLRILVFLWCAVILCLLFGLIYVYVIFFHRLMMGDHRQLMAFARFFLRVGVGFLILITGGAVYGWGRFARRTRDKSFDAAQNK